MRKSRVDTASIKVSKTCHGLSIGQLYSYIQRSGTWVPLADGRVLAERNGVLDKLRPLFDYVPGDISPPQAPKHATNKPKLPKPAQPNKKQSGSKHTHKLIVTNTEPRN